MLKILALEGGGSGESRRRMLRIPPNEHFHSPRAVRSSKASSFSSSFLYDDQSLSSLACVPLLKLIVCNFILPAYLNTSPMGDFDGLGLIANTEKKQLYLNKNRLKNWCMTAC